MKSVSGSNQFVLENNRKGKTRSGLRTFGGGKPTEFADQKALLQANYGQVKAYLSVFGINYAYLEDAVQDTMVEALASFGSLKDMSKFKYWLLVIAKRVGLRYVALSKSQKECSYEECVENGKETEFVSDRQLVSYMSRLDNEELARIINETLSEKEKKVIMLYYVYEHKLKEIAEIIGETHTNTRTLSARAKKKLKVKLEEGGFHEG